MILAVPSPTDPESSRDFLDIDGDQNETPVRPIAPIRPRWAHHEGYDEIGSGFSSETGSRKLSDSGHPLSPKPILRKGPRPRRPAKISQFTTGLLDQPEEPATIVPTIVVEEVPSSNRLKPSSGLNRRKSFKDRISEVSKDVNRMQHDLREELKENLVDFMDSTTAHGIPMVMSTKSIVMRVVWVCFSIISLCVFVYQCHQVYERYIKRDKIVNVQLIFESPHFPAITMCNLNPFKKHSIRSISEVRETLDNYHQAVVFSKTHSHMEAIERKKRDASGRPQYLMRRRIQYEPVISDCDCIRGIEQECVWSKKTVPQTMAKACICTFDNSDRAAWPCYNSQMWKGSTCPECNDLGYCNVPNSTGTDEIPCMCNLVTGSCLFKPEKLKQVWHFMGNTVPNRTSEFFKDYVEKLRSSGYENVTDQVTITTVTKELLIMQMASVDEGRRMALSYGKDEFIKMCSFNGKQCDISEDFRALVDTSFGNCFTFNWKKGSNLTSSRAGPDHGLRVMLYVNVSDYLPTTEATGVRIVIHGQDDRPFPDTFGYSAPTGAVSSFGISLREVNRIPLQKDCYSRWEKFDKYIYENYEYTPEGCYRTLYQEAIEKECHCADPRFPRRKMSDGSYKHESCDTMDPMIRECMLVAAERWQRANDRAEKLKSGPKTDKQKFCRHPCEESVYGTTYSAAKWPSSDINVDCLEMGPEECIKHYSENAAMLEIYYEQLSYEVLKETEAYLLVNLVSDIGGQAGLWLGASVLTLIEIFVLVFKLATACCRRCEPKKKTSTDNENNNNGYRSSQHHPRKRRRFH